MMSRRWCWRPFIPAGESECARVCEKNKTQFLGLGVQTPTKNKKRKKGIEIEVETNPRVCLSDFVADGPGGGGCFVLIVRPFVGRIFETRLVEW